MLHRISKHCCNNANNLNILHWLKYTTDVVCAYIGKKTIHYISYSKDRCNVQFITLIFWPYFEPRPLLLLWFAVKLLCSVVPIRFPPAVLLELSFFLFPVLSSVILTHSFPNHCFELRSPALRSPVLLPRNFFNFEARCRCLPCGTVLHLWCQSFVSLSPLILPPVHSLPTLSLCSEHKSTVDVPWLHFYY